MYTKKVLATIVFCCLTILINAQDINDLKNAILKILSDKRAVVGVSIKGINANDTLSINGNLHYPLQSVFKMHIALTVLSDIDKNRFRLNQKVLIKKNELLPNLWSPLREDYPNGTSISIAKLIQYAVSQSDNVACDVLLKLLGSPKYVENYFKKNNFRDIEITFNEQQLDKKWENKFKNWTTPLTATDVLYKFYHPEYKLLSKKSYAFFWKSMSQTNTGLARLKGLLPSGTVVAHKTGTSGTSKEGLTAAINDVGIVFLPGNSHYIISVFVTQSKETEEENEKIIAQISKTAWDYFSNKTQER